MNIGYSSRLARNPLTNRNYKIEGDISFNEWKNSLSNEQKTALKYVDKSAESGIINKRGGMVIEYTKLGKIETGLFEKEFGKLRTDEIIITNERVEHIKSHHPEDYELFLKYGADTVKNPDEIVRDMKNEGTVFLIKYLEHTNLNVVSRLVLQTDNEKLKHSVMTFYRIRQKNLVKLENKNKILYKKE